MLNELPFFANIPVADLDRARKFYEGALGLHSWRIDERIQEVVYEAGPARFAVYVSAGAGKSEHTIGTFLVTDMDLSSPGCGNAASPSSITTSQGSRRRAGSPLSATTASRGSRIPTATSLLSLRSSASANPRRRWRRRRSHGILGPHRPPRSAAAISDRSASSSRG